MSDQLLSSRAKLGCGCEYMRSSVLFCSQPEQLPSQAPWHLPGLPCTKAGTDAALQPCLPQISFLPSCRVLAGQRRFAGAAL